MTPAALRAAFNVIPRVSLAGLPTPLHDATRLRGALGGAARALVADMVAGGAREHRGSERQSGHLRRSGQKRLRTRGAAAFVIRSQPTKKPPDDGAAYARRQ